MEKAICESVDMVRDMELVRTLILGIEADEHLDGVLEVNDYEPSRFGADGYSDREMAYHLDLLINSGFVDGKVHGGGSLPTIRHLTMLGHDFADGTRNKTVWHKTMATVKEKGGDFTITMLLKLVEDLLMRHFMPDHPKS